MRHLGSWLAPAEALAEGDWRRITDLAKVPAALFVTATDTGPLAPSTAKILEGSGRDFANGLKVLSGLTEGKVHLCIGPGETVPAPVPENVETSVFAGPHPAGNVGTHIHFLAPAGREREVWHIGAQDAAAVGALFTTGRLRTDRVTSLAGPPVNRPRLVRTRIGANLHDLVAGELQEGAHRVVSGSVLDGRGGAGPTGFLGRYHQQVSVLAEGGRRRFLGWLSPGADLYSVKNILLSSLFPGKRFAMTTELHGDMRAIFPVGSYEKVMPLDILPAFLLRALAVDDVEEAEKLGCLELTEEDLALCTFVCPSKVDHGANLRRVLNIIEKEG